jgi:hypothetical protein
VLKQREVLLLIWFLLLNIYFHALWVEEIIQNILYLYLISKIHSVITVQLIAGTSQNIINMNVICCTV